MYKFVKTFVPVLAALTLAACDQQNQERAAEAERAAAASPVKPVTATEVSHPPPSLEEAANLSYRGVFDDSVAFRDGEWQGEPYVAGGASAPRAGLVADFRLTGDLDGDAGDEAVVLIWSSGGGSGTFDYVAVLDRGIDGVAFNRATTPLGDRVKVRSAAIQNSRVVLETVQAGAQDAACCPGQKMRRSFALEGTTMEEISSEDLGRISLADVAGEWKLVAFGAGEEVPPEVEITAQFSAGTIAGKAACNRYTGGVQEGDMPGALSLSGPLALTRMMCPPPLMEWERRYVQALEGLEQYSFQTGKLLLSWRDEDGWRSMLFARVDGAEAIAE